MSNKKRGSAKKVASTTVADNHGLVTTSVTTTFANLLLLMPESKLDGTFNSPKVNHHFIDSGYLDKVHESGYSLCGIMKEKVNLISSLIVPKIVNDLFFACYSLCNENDEGALSLHSMASGARRKAGAELKNILSIDIRTIQGLKSFAVQYKLDLSDGTNYDSYYSLFSKIKEHLTEHGFVAPVEGLHRIAAALKTLKEDVASVDSMLHAGLIVNLVISPLCLDTLRIFSRSLCHLNSSHTKIYLIDELSRALSTVDDELKTIDSKLLSVYVKGESRTVWAPFKERMKAIMKGAVAFCQGSPLLSQYLDSAYLEKKNITIDNILDVVGKRGKLSFFPLVFTDTTRIIPKEVKAFLNLLVIYVSFGYTGSDIVSRKLFTSTENTVSVLQTYNECVEKYFPKFEKMGFHQQAVIGLKYFPQFKNSLGLVFSDDSKMSTSILPGMLKDFLNTRQSLATRQVSFSVLLDVNEFVNPSPPESIDGLPAALANSTATEPMPPLDDDEQNGETVVNPTFPLVMSSLPFKRKMTFNSAVEREQFVRDATAAMLDVYTNVFRHSPGVDVVTAFQDSYLKVKEKLKKAKAKKQEGTNDSSTDDSDEE